MEAGVVTRIHKHGVELTPELEFGLIFGPGPISDDLSDEDLAVGWRIHGAQLMATWEMRHGCRPWGWWVFEKGEPPPPQQPGADVIRLAKLGELTEAECAALARHAAEARAQLDSGIQCYVATGGGRRLNFEQRPIDLWERAQEALRHPHQA